MNHPIIDRLSRVIARRQAEGLFRQDADAVEIHMAVAALGMFNVTNRYTFGAIVQREKGTKGDVSRRWIRMANMIVSYLTKFQRRPSQEETMHFNIDRRSALKAGAALAASWALPLRAQTKPTIRFAAVFSDRDIRAGMIQMLAKDIEGDFRLEPFYNGTLFKQGTELVALQRNNLEMGNVAPQDISNQVPAWSILTSAYLFRDAHHLNAFFASDLGAQMKKTVEDQLKVKILGPTFFGTRQLGLKPKKKIATPADLAGIKLRMPGGDAWQLLGRSLGANPVPMAYPEVYTGMQTGAIDGQDNPLPNVQNMKFYEVMSQVVLTSHLVGFDLLTINLRLWSGMTTPQQQRFQAAANKAIDWSASEHLKREAELAQFLKTQGLEVYTPDIKAFREHAQKIYLASDAARSWPQGMLEKIAALK